MEDDELMVKDLKVMKNKQNILVLMSLSKVSAIQKRWLVTECKK